MCHSAIIATDAHEISISIGMGPSWSVETYGKDGCAGATAGTLTNSRECMKMNGA